MTTPAVPAPRPLPVATPAAAYARQSLAPATLRAYRVGWEALAAWRQREGRAALPATPETVAAHFAALATTYGRSALRRRHRPSPRSGRFPPPGVQPAGRAWQEREEAEFLTRQAEAARRER